MTHNWSKSLEWKFRPEANRLVVQIFCLFPGFLWVIYSWPARLSGDSLSVLSDIKLGIQNDWHTLIYRDFVFLTSFGGLYPQLTSIIQVISLTFSIFYLCNVLFPQGSMAPVTTILIMATPYGGGMATTLWKDVLFCTFSIISLAISIRLYKKSYHQSINITVLFFLITIVTLSRHEVGFLLCIGGIYYALKSIFIQNTTQFRYSCLVILSAIAGMIISDASVSLRNAVPVPEYVKYASFASDLAYVSKVAPDGNEDLGNFVQKFSTGDSFRNADYCGTINGFFYSEGFNGDYLTQNVHLLFKNWISSWVNNPELMLQHRMCTAAPFIPYPLSTGPSYNYLLHPGIDSNSLGYEFSPVRFTNETISKLSSALLILFLELFWPGLVLTFSTILFFSVRRKIHKFEQFWFVKLALEISFLQSILMFFFSGAQDFRYMALSVIILLISFGSILTLLSSTRINGEIRDGAPSHLKGKV